MVRRFALIGVLEVLRLIPLFLNCLGQIVFYGATGFHQSRALVGIL